MCRARSNLVTAHRRPESVIVIVYNDGGETLLLQRVQPFSFWQSITGSLDAGESPVETAQRELREETGLVDAGILIDSQQARTFTIDPRWRNRYAPGVAENTEHEFRYRLDGRVEIRIDKTEHDRFRWLPIDDAIAAVWSWTNKAALQALQSELRGEKQSV